VELIPIALNFRLGKMGFILDAILKFLESGIQSVLLALFVGGSIAVNEPPHSLDRIEISGLNV